MGGNPKNSVADSRGFGSWGWGGVCDGAEGDADRARANIALAHAHAAVACKRGCGGFYGVMRMLRGRTARAAVRMSMVATTHPLAHQLSTTKQRIGL